MAYVIGMLTPQEEAELKKRGWKLEDPPAELIPIRDADDEPPNMKMVWIDSDMFQIMSGEPWEKPVAVGSQYLALQLVLRREDWVELVHALATKIEYVSHLSNNDRWKLDLESLYNTIQRMVEDQGVEC